MNMCDRNCTRWSGYVPSLSRCFVLDATNRSVYTRRMSVTLAEAAERLGVSPITLRVQIRNGRLTATKVSRDWYVEEAEVERYRDESLGRWYRRDFGKDGFSHILYRIMPSARHRKFDIKGIVGLASQEAKSADALMLQVELHTARMLMPPGSIRITEHQRDSGEGVIRMKFEGSAQP